MIIICPLCGKDIPSREFYDHMGNHGWSLSEAERYADDRYLETHSSEVQSPNQTAEAEP